MSARFSLRHRLRGGTLALAVLALIAAVLAPTAAAQSRNIGTVVIANGWSSADSAVASALAALESDSRSDAVVLYASRRELPSRVANYIEDHQPAEVILVGGTAALSSNVQADVADLVGSGSVRRIEGRDRFDTAAKAVPSTATTFIVANGYSAADTGVAAAVAATRDDAAVLLAEADSLTEHTERIIREQEPLAVEFVGGTAVLAAELADRVMELAPSIRRVPRHSGASRTATAAAAAPNRSTTLVIANGWSPADMGVAAAYAAITTNAAVLYSEEDSLTTPTENRIRALAPRAIVLVGGSAALDTSLHTRLRTLAPRATIHRISGSDRIDTAVRAADGRLTEIATDPPAAPTSLTLTARNAGLTVSWAAPTRTTDTSSNDDPEVTGYAIQYRACTAADTTCRTSPRWGSWRSYSHSGTSTSTTISSLINGTAYQVQVRARNSAGLGPWSSTETGTPLAQTARPSVPSGLTVEAANRELKVSWSPSIPPRNGTVSGYEVEYRRCPTSTTCSSWISHSHSGTGTTTTITRLNNGISYEVRVQATSTRGVSGWSPTRSATPALLPQFATAPVLAPGDRSILVRWNVPLNSGSGVTDYDLERRACTATDSDSSDLTCTPDDKATWGSWQPFGFTGTATTATITGLTNGTAYEVRVRARSAAGIGPWSPASSEVPVSAPARVTGVAVEADDVSLVVTWVVPSSNGKPITGYNVQHCLTTADCSADGTGWNDADPSGAVRRHTVRSLVNDLSYRVRVRAVNAEGAGPWSSSVTGTPKAVPAAPAAPTLEASNRTIDVEWVEPDDRGEDITAYGIQYRWCSATPRDCSETVRWSGWRSRSHSGTGVEAEITGLTNATEYEVRVRARSATGWGPWSATAQEIPFTVPAKPAKPTAMAGNDQLVMEWRPPAANGREITGYHVQHCASYLDCSRDGNWTPGTPPLLELMADKETGKITHDLTGLVNGTTYGVRVRAVNEAGNGPWSDTVSGTPATLPAAPATPTLSPASGEIVVVWQRPANNGAAITGYHVEYRRCTATPADCSSSETWSTWSRHAHSGIGRSATIRGLTNGTKYQVQVRANTANGAGPWSPAAEETPRAVPSKPTDVMAHPDDVSLSVTWTASVPNGSMITGYALQYRACTATRLDCSTGATWGDWTPGGTPGPDAEAATISSLNNGTKYQVQVRATISGGGSAWSQIASAIPAAVPAAPAAPTVTGQDQQLVVAWVAPADRGEAVTGYDIRYRSCSSATPDCSDAQTEAWGNWQTHTHSGTGTNAIIPGLIDGTAYQVQVRARNDNGWGPWSPSPTDPGVPSGAPARPTQPRVTPGGGQLEVDWIPPEPKGSTITGYEVQYRACIAAASPFMVRSCSSNPRWGPPQTESVNDPEETTATLLLLTNGTAYEVQVRAVAGARPGPWSEPVVKTPVATPAAPATVEVASGSGQLYVRWSTPNSMGSAVNGYKVEYCDNTQTSAPCSDDANWTTRTINGANSRTVTISGSGVTNGTSHLVRVSTRSSDHGVSPASGEVPATPGGPNTPSTPQLMAGNGVITVRWTAPSVSGRTAITRYEVAHCTDVDDDNSLTDDCTDSLDTVIVNNWTVAPHTDVDNRSLELTSLTNGESYRVRVRAQNAEGWSRWSSMATATPRS